jgi:hypothetical protein
MNKFLSVILIAGFVAGIQTISFASDWDKAGKVLAVTEGLRIVTGGAFDVLGSITGVKERTNVREGRGYSRCDDRPSYIVRKVYQPQPRHVERIWVPHLVWQDKFVPEHTEYREGYGNVWIGAHYEKFQVEQGGHWEVNEDMCYVRR